MRGSSSAIVRATLRARRRRSPRSSTPCSATARWCAWRPVPLRRSAGARPWPERWRHADPGRPGHPEAPAERARAGDDVAARPARRRPRCRRPDPARARRRRRDLAPNADLPAPFERLRACRASRCARPSGPATSPGSPKACAGWACVRWSARSPAPCRCPCTTRGRSTTPMPLEEDSVGEAGPTAAAAASSAW